MIRVGVTLQWNLSSNLFDLIQEPVIQKTRQSVNTGFNLSELLTFFNRQNNYRDRKGSRVELQLRSSCDCSTKKKVLKQGAGLGQHTDTQARARWTSSKPTQHRRAFGMQTAHSFIRRALAATAFPRRGNAMGKQACRPTGLLALEDMVHNRRSPPSRFIPLES